ncbi:Multidrug transporter EmrE [Ruminococcaceae bacterium KH2T8]|nr:Multidrug transporter EmrE [Ruminococcaceae bacterium KH2T8]
MRKAKTIILLHLLIAFFSFGGVCSKMAAGEKFLSPKFCLYYAGLIFILGVYAIAWQQIIKRLPLTFAYANKAVGIIWTMLWGVLIFHEMLTPQKVIGSLVVMAGIILYTRGEKYE